MCCRFKYWRLVKFPISLGMNPLSNSFLANDKFIKFLHWYQIEGNFPDNSFSWTKNLSRFGSPKHTFVRRLPEKRFLWSSMYSSIELLNNVSGIDPESIFSPRYNIFNCWRLPIPLGMPPSNMQNKIKTHQLKLRITHLIMPKYIAVTSYYKCMK